MKGTVFFFCCLTFFGKGGAISVLLTKAIEEETSLRPKKNDIKKRAVFSVVG